MLKLDGNNPTMAKSSESQYSLMEFITRGEGGGIWPAPDPYLRHAASEQRINCGTCTVRRRDRWRRPLSIPLCIDTRATLWRVVWQHLSPCQHCRCQVHHAPPQSVGQVDRDQVRGGQLSSEGSKRAAGAVLMCEVSQTSGRVGRGGVRSLGSASSEGITSSPDPGTRQPAGLEFQGNALPRSPAH
jgi:hypothetical protein